MGRLRLFPGCRRVASWSVSLLLLAAAANAAVPVPASFTLERFEHASKPPAGGVVLINPWGDVRVKQGATDEVLFNAVMQLIGDEPLRGEFEHRIEGDRLVLELRYPESGRPATPSQGRIDAGIILPSGVPLEIHADRGRVMTKTLDSPLTIRAIDGAIDAKTRSRVDIETHDGPVRLVVRPGEPARDIGRISSSRGDIELQFARDVPMVIDAGTGASITTNDPDLLTTRREQGRRSMFGDDPEASRIRLDSDSGRLLLVNRSRIPGANPDPADED